MQKYRLTWDGKGSLDLSQVLDERGIPVFFKGPGASVVVTAGAMGHPFIKNYMKAGLRSEPLTPAVNPIQQPKEPPQKPAPTPPLAIKQEVKPVEKPVSKVTPPQANVSGVTVAQKPENVSKVTPPQANVSGVTVEPAKEEQPKRVEKETKELKPVSKVTPPQNNVSGVTLEEKKEEPAQDESKSEDEPNTRSSKRRSRGR